MTTFARLFGHLLPTGEAWRQLPQKTLSKFFAGLSGLGQETRDFADEAYLDLFPETTRELAEWEHFYGLSPAPTEEARRLALAAEWRSTGGQSPSYIQGVLQSAGFDVYVHEWWSSTGPYVARDPHDYTTAPLVGSIQCGQDEAMCGDLDAQCNGFLLNVPRYFDSLFLGPVAPPAIPEDPDLYPYFLYVGAEDFPDEALIPSERFEELRRLIQKLKPAQQWIVILADGVDFLVTEDLDELITEDGDFLVA